MICRTTYMETLLTSRTHLIELKVLKMLKVTRPSYTKETKENFKAKTLKIFNVYSSLGV